MVSDVKRWQAWIIADNVQRFVNQPELFVTDEEHEEIVATLRAEVAELKVREAAAYKVYKEMSATMGHNANTIDELRAEVAEMKERIDVFKNREYEARTVEELREELDQKGAELLRRETELETSQRVREKLELQRTTLISLCPLTSAPNGRAMLDVFQDEIAAIEKDGTK